MFATDRTLLSLEPTLFQNVAFLPQRLTSGTCDVSGTTLSATSLDPDFYAAGLAPGHVVSIDSVSYEIVTVASATEIKISRLRADPSAAEIPPPAMSSRPFTIDSFGPQIALAHTKVLQLLGLATSDSQPSLPGESALLNPGDFAAFEATIVLQLILNAAGALSHDTPALAVLRTAITTSLREMRHTLTAYIDRNGDGLADSRRRLDLQHLIRS